jgi:hypothetical protein
MSGRFCDMGINECGGTSENNQAKRDYSSERLSPAPPRGGGRGGCFPARERKGLKFPGEPMGKDEFVKFHVSTVETT